jgi:hypothetical protein
MSTIEDLKAQKAQITPKLMRIPGVIAVGIGLLEDGQPGIIITCRPPKAQIEAHLPPETANVRITLRESGDIVAH